MTLLPSSAFQPVLSSKRLDLRRKPSLLPPSEIMNDQNMNEDARQTTDQNSWYCESTVAQPGSSYGKMDANVGMSNNNISPPQGSYLLNDYLRQQSLDLANRYTWADDPKRAHSKHKKQVEKQIRDKKGSSSKFGQKHRSDNRHHNDTEDKKRSSSNHGHKHRHDDLHHGDTHGKNGSTKK